MYATAPFEQPLLSNHPFHFKCKCRSLDDQTSRLQSSFRLFHLFPSWYGSKHYINWWNQSKRRYFSAYRGRKYLRTKLSRFLLFPALFNCHIITVLVGWISQHSFLNLTWLNLQALTNKYEKWPITSASLIRPNNLCRLSLRLKEETQQILGISDFASHSWPKWSLRARKLYWQFICCHTIVNWIKLLKPAFQSTLSCYWG